MWRSRAGGRHHRGPGGASNVPRVLRTQGQEAKASAPGEEPNKAGRPEADAEADSPKAARLTHREVWGTLEAPPGPL